MNKAIRNVSSLFIFFKISLPMKLFFKILFFCCCSGYLQAQEGQIRMPVSGIAEETVVEKPAEQDVPAYQEKPVKVSKVLIKAHQVRPIPTNRRFATSNQTAIKRNLKRPVQVLDSVPPRKSSLARIGCFLQEPLELISLGVEMFELTKPPKSAFMIILYVIYIVPLFAIITSFIIGGILGLVSFILACGLLAFLLYWLTLALMGMALTGNLILWGIVGAFVIGLILYLLLIRLCKQANA